MFSALFPRFRRNDFGISLASLASSSRNIPLGGLAPRWWGFNRDQGWPVRALYAPTGLRTSGRGPGLRGFEGFGKPIAEAYQDPRR